MAAPAALPDAAQYRVPQMGPDYDDNTPTADPIFSASEQDEGFPLDPGAKALFEKCGWMRKVPVFGKTSAAYGPKTSISLGVTYFMLKGVADLLIRSTVFAMLVTRFGADARHYQRLTPMATMGWAIKAFTAMFCDGFALFGYTKRWYIAGSAVLGAVFALALGVLPAKPSSVDIGGAFIFLTSFFKANFDILAEGHYSRLIRKVPKAGPSLVTWIWFLILFGCVIASALAGPLSDKGLQHVCVFIAAGLQLVTVIFPIFNWYGEKTNRVERAEDARNNYLDSVKEHQRLLERERAEAGYTSDSNRTSAPLQEDLVAPENKGLHPENSDSYEEAGVDMQNMLVDDINYHHDANGQLVTIDHDAMAEEAAANVTPATPCCCGVFELNKETMTRNWRIFVYCGVMTCSVLAMMISNIVAPTVGIVVVCGTVSLVCCGLSFWALPMTIAKANVFAYLHMACYLTIGPMDNFYMATPECLPNAPHFSFTFYKTVGGIIGYAAGMIGTLGFNYIFSKRSYRVTFMITCSAQIIASIFDIIIIKRWNVAIGIPDHAMYICGDAIVYQACYLLAWMPLMLLNSRLCPRGSESVVFALVAGFSNLGTSTSSIITSILMEYAWPIKSTIPCNFDNLVWLVLVGHFCTPLLIFPLTLLLPSARCCDDLDIDGKAIRREIKANKNKKNSQNDDESNHPFNEKPMQPIVTGEEADAEPYMGDETNRRNHH